VEAARASEGERLAAVSNALVGLLRQGYGRGPTKAKSHLLDDLLLVVMEDILTTVEHTLVARGREELVRDVRLAYQEAESDRFIDAVERTVERKVVAYHSQVTFRPDMAFEIFVLDPRQ
jgi:uncharacterized protein YbcI